MGDPKPLSRTKRSQALQIAHGHSELRSALAGRNRAVLAEPNLTDRGQEDDADQVVLGVYDYERDRALMALVDLKRKAVLAVEPAIAQLQLDDDERREAEELAAVDSRARAFLRGRPMNPLTRLYFPPGSGTQHRYAIVFLRPNSSERRYAVVDLSHREVVDVLAPGALAG